MTIPISPEDSANAALFLRITEDMRHGIAAVDTADGHSLDYKQNLLQIGDFTVQLSPTVIQSFRDGLKLALETLATQALSKAQGLLAPVAPAPATTAAAPAAAAAPESPTKTADATVLENPAASAAAVGAPS